MRKLLLSASALVLALVLFTGCSAFLEGFKEGFEEAQEKLSSSDSAKSDSADNDSASKSSSSGLSVDFPDTWKETELNDIAILEMSRVAKEQYMIVIEEDGSNLNNDFTLGDYTEIIKNNMTGAVEDAEVSTLSDVTIDGRLTTKQFELSGSVQKIKVKYLVTCMKNDNTFYQFISWSTQSKYAEAKPVFESILKTVTF